MFLGAVFGVFISVLWAGFAYAIARAKSGEEFTPRKFAKTVIVGAAIGVLAQVLGLPPIEVETLTVEALLTIVVDKLAGLIVKS